MEIIIENHPMGYKVITCPEGYVFTDWNKENVLEFSCSTIAYAPMDYDTSAYYTMTVEAADIIMKEMEEKIQNGNNQL